MIFEGFFDVPAPAGSEESVAQDMEMKFRWCSPDGREVSSSLLLSELASADFDAYFDPRFQELFSQEVDEVILEWFPREDGESEEDRRER